MTARVDVNRDGEILRLATGSGFVPLVEHRLHRLAVRAYDLSSEERAKIPDVLRRCYVMEQDGAPGVHHKTKVRLSADKDRIEADGRDVVRVTASRGGVALAVNRRRVGVVDASRTVGLTTREAKLLVIEVDDPRFFSEPVEVLATMTLADDEQEGGVQSPPPEGGDDADD